MTDEFIYLILEIVLEIPKGKVATYGQIALLAGYPKNARLVGKVLSHAELFGHYPCHRVVNHMGKCATAFPEQKALLQQEGVIFKENNCVDMKHFQWKSKASGN